MMNQAIAFGAAALLLAVGQAGADTPAKPGGKPGMPVFPAAVDRKYAGESPGRARMHTCRDQYHANKVSHANGDLKWIQSGGGYYSQCAKKLKG
jgi:hypothetical protein